MGIGCCRAFGNSPQVVTVGPALSPALWLHTFPNCIFQTVLGHRMAVTRVDGRLSNTHVTACVQVFTQALCSLLPHPCPPNRHSQSAGWGEAGQQAL